MASNIREFEREMQALEAEIRRLEIEYNMFFAGRAPRLPWEQRARVEALVRRYDRAEILNTADRFRFHALQSRYSAFVELWERQLKAQEQGRFRAPRAASTGAHPAPQTSRHDDPPPASRVPEFAEHVVRLHDPEAETERVHELYEYLVAARHEAGQAAPPYERIEALVRDQVQKFGPASDLVFKVALKEGRVLLTVTPVDGE